MKSPHQTNSNDLKRQSNMFLFHLQNLHNLSHPLVFLYTFRTYAAHGQSILRILFLLNLQSSINPHVPLHLQNQIVYHPQHAL